MGSNPFGPTIFDEFCFKIMGSLNVFCVKLNDIKNICSQCIQSKKKLRMMARKLAYDAIDEELHDDDFEL